MADDLDEQLRRAMKTLDSGVPTGYFEDLPRRALARLEGSMESSSTTQRSGEAAEGVPPIQEDSGLHDIRSLAQSTKARLHVKRMSSPSLEDEAALLASSSAGWKVVALPEPAKMVSLPELDELPSKDVIRTQVRAAQKAAKAAAKQAKATAKQTKADAKPAVVITTAAASATAEPKAVPAASLSLPSQQARRAYATRRGAIYAVAGVLVVSAAAAGIFIATRSGGHAGPAQVAEAPPAARPAPTVATIETPPPPPVQVAVAEPPTPVAQEATAPVAVEAAPVATPVTKAAPHAKAKAPEKVVVKVEAAASTKAAVVAKPTPTQAKLKKDGDPSLDDLLKEAGEDQPKKAAKPVLANKALSGEDFKHGMSAIAARAQGCYKATQGMAQIKITVAPSGQVSKVSVTGQFAGKPEGNCVVNAVKAATFPPWDGGPQTFGYSYLLAE